MKFFSVLSHPPVHDAPMVWRELADRDDIYVHVVPLPDGVNGACRIRNGVTTIALSNRLDQSGRRATLAHELAHMEAGGGIDASYMPSTWQPVVAREETRCDRRAAMVSIDWDRLRQIADSGEQWTIEEIAAELGVPAWVIAA